MPMPALAIVSADLMAPGPQAAASPNTGNEGLFAAHLKNATDQQNAASTSPAGAAQKHGRGRHVHDAGAKKNNTALFKGVAEEAAAASPNGVANAIMSQPEPTMQTDTDQPEHMLGNPLAIDQQSRESAMARLLAKLTASITAETGNDLRAKISSQTSQPSVQQPNLKMAGQQANQQSAPQPAQVQLPDELASVAAQAATPAIEMEANPAAAASVGQSINPGAQAKTATLATFIAGLAANQATSAAKQSRITITVAASQATESADAAPLAPSAPAATVEAGIPAANAQAQTGAPMVVQNKYSQIITIHQEKPGEEEGEGSVPASTTSDKQPIDVNANYIRSRLLRNNADSAMKSEKNSQTDSSSQAARQQEQTPAAEAVKSTAGEQFASQKAQPVMNQESSPLIAASLPQGTGQQASSTPIASVTMHLPSGMSVPDGTVVDQMIAHFSINRQLENSTVRLRLYPEELGELRMEIKVAQDNIRAHIVVQNPQAQEMIDRHLPRLREALEQQGLQLQQVEVSVAAHGQTGGERFQENNTWSQQAPSPGSHVTSQSDFTQELEEIAGDDKSTNTLSVLV